MAAPMINIESILSQFELIQLPPKTRLYHGSKHETIPAFTRPAWFSLDYIQSSLHALDDLFPDIETQTSCSTFMHVFETVRPITLIRLTPTTFVHFSQALTGKLLLPFGRDDYEVSQVLCTMLQTQSHISGWVLYEDQRQVMLCVHPRQELVLKHISSESIFSSPELFILCELVNSLHEVFVKEINPYLKKVKKEKFDLYFEMLRNNFPRPQYVVSNPTGKLISGEVFDQFRHIFIAKPSLLEQWQGFYVYDPATVEDSLSSMVSKLNL